MDKIRLVLLDELEEALVKCRRHLDELEEVRDGLKARLKKAEDGIAHKKMPRHMQEKPVRHTQKKPAKPKKATDSRPFIAAEAIAVVGAIIWISTD